MEENKPGRLKNQYSLTLQATYAYIEGMKKKPYSQLTIRKVPLLVADRIKILSAKEGKSMNTLSIEILQRGLGLEGEVPVNHDLDEFIGTWKNDPEFDGVLESMRNIEPELWK